ncbi:MAG: rhomboid family intramembrane serine protease [Planctomycetales bacterium]|nr:rhomboid family intramembrane serine protease [Planctomycetales bacterium]
MLDLRSKIKPPTKFIHSIRDELIGVLIFVGIMWVVFIVDYICGSPLSGRFALIPRSFSRLPGIIAMPFLHRDFSHIGGNTLPLLVLMWLLAGSRAQSWKIVTLICLFGGTLLWLFGNPVDFFKGLIVEQSVIRPHVGASLLIFGLVTFLMSSGYFESRPIPLLISVLVAVLYGTTLLGGVIPKAGVSWEGHLSGAVAGVIVAYWLVKHPASFAKSTKPLDFVDKKKTRAGTS